MPLSRLWFYELHLYTKKKKSYEIQVQKIKHAPSVRDISKSTEKKWIVIILWDKKAREKKGKKVYFTLSRIKLW